MVDWVAFVPASVLVSLIPGANQIVSVRNAIRYGALSATIGLLGRFSAFAMMAGAVSLGLGAVLSRSAVAFEVVKWLGVAYLCCLGVRALLGSRRRTAESLDNATRDETPVARRIRRATRHEFLVAITNPKAMLLFAAFLPQFLPRQDATSPSLLLLAAAYIGIEAVSAVGYALVGGRLGEIDLTARAHRRLDAATGASFLGLGGYLAVEQRP